MKKEEAGIVGRGTGLVNFLGSRCEKWYFWAKADKLTSKQSAAGYGLYTDLKQEIIKISMCAERLEMNLLAQTLLESADLGQE